MEETASASGAVATLDADVRPWEKALDNAAEKANGWGDKVRGYLEKATSLLNTENIDNFRAKLQGVAQGGQLGDQFAEDFGGALGNVLGEVQVFGFKLGPVGNLIGEELGAGIVAGLQGSEIISDGAQLLDDVLAGFQDLTAGVTGSWDSMVLDAGDAYSDIKDIFRNTDWEEIINMPLDEAWEKVSEIVGEIWQKIEDFGAQAVARLADAIDSVWAKIQEPIARFADWLQRMLTDLGLVQEGTASWGDAIRSVGDIGEKVIGAIGYGLGFLEGLLKKVGGYIGEYLVAPLADGLYLILNTFADGIRMIAESPELKLAAGVLGIDLDGLASGLDKFNTKLADQTAKLREASKEFQNIDPFATAEAGRAGLLQFAQDGKEMINVKDDRRNQPQPIPEPELPDEVMLPQFAEQLSKAIMAGSREAANLQARAGSVDAQIQRLEQLARVADEQRALQADMKRELEAIKNNTENSVKVAPI